MGRHSRPGRRGSESAGLPALAARGLAAGLVLVVLTAATFTHSDTQLTRPSTPATSSRTADEAVSGPGAGPPEPTAHPQRPAERLSAARELRQRRAAQRASRVRTRTQALLRAQLRDCPSTVDQDHPNGQLPAHSLCALPSGAMLRADAARGMVLLLSRARRDLGDAVCIGGGYRSYREQAELYATKPGLAAAAGSSNHGFGTAVDLCGDAGREGTTAHRWLDATGPRFGWVHRGWAQPGGSRPEPWHLEYLPKLDGTRPAR